LAEEREGPEMGTETAPITDSTAMALALGGASRERADAFLKKQEALVDKQTGFVDIQSHHLHEQLKQIHLGIWEKWLGVLLRVATAAVGLAIAAGLSSMVWDAAHSGGLIIEPFAVPADMAAKGLSGQVVASQMLDKLTVMQNATDSGRSPQSYENNWGDNIRVEIPETGISIGELQRFLKGWLGHDTHITGEVWRTPTGIAVTAREGAEPGATFTGPESDLDALMQKVAEHVYGITQPYRYANFLYYSDTSAPFADRVARASVIYRKLIAGPNPRERAWAWNGLATMAAFNDVRQSIFYYQKSIDAQPDFTLGYFGLDFMELRLGYYEKALSAARTAESLFDRSNVPDVNPKQLSLRRLRNTGYLALAKGDYREALRNFKLGAGAPESFANLPRIQYTQAALVALANLHDGGGIRAYLLDLGVSSIEKRFGNDTALLVAMGQEDWPTILRLQKPVANRDGPKIQAVTALAHAHTGDLQGAQALIAQCPNDSDDCLIGQGRIADMQGQAARADGWFARAEQREPSVPFADSAWGQALLSRGKPDAAIEKFKLANKKGPHFADPLEYWGEALMAKNQSHLALAKFAEAEKYAPNWGRLHLKWGEALGYAGKADEAKAQFARAAALDLTPSEKSELARAHP
jgi:tetratricopeptide (TPR) repeat protein